MSGITIHNRQRACKVDGKVKSAMQGAMEAALERFDMVDAEVWLGLVSNRRIKEINLQTRDIDSETDVLSFPAIEWQNATPGDIGSVKGHIDRNPETKAIILGDIMIALPYAYDQAGEYGHSTEREMAFLALHGLLHLLGFDHEDEKGAEQMEALQEQILLKLGILR